MYDVENVFIYIHVMLFCLKIGFVVIYAVLLRNLFCRNLRTFVWRKIKPKIEYVETNDKYRVCFENSETHLIDDSLH